MTTSNDKRCFTVMIVPHSEEATFSLRIPLFVVQLAVALLVFGVAAFSVLGYAYLRAVAGAKDAETLRQINRVQQEEINALALETERLMEQMREVDELVDMVIERIELTPDLREAIETQSFSSANPHGGYKSNSNNVNSNPQLFSEYEHLGVDHSHDSRSSSNGILERAAGNLALLQSIVPEQSDALNAFSEYIEKERAKPALWPARGRISSGFGVRRVPYARSGYQFHTGVDIIGSRGSAIWATADGRVTFTGYRGSLGNIVVICHGNNYETYYAHLSGFAVVAGDEVERGQVIGYMGSSGRTTGTHLHYEVHNNGSPVNPYNYMKQR